MRMRLRHLFTVLGLGLALALALTLSACGSLTAANDGGDDDDDITGDGGPDDAPIDAPPEHCERDDLSIEDFLDCSGEVANELFERCTGDIGDSDFRRVVSDFAFFGDLPIPVGKEFLPDAVDRGTINYDPEAGQACLDSLRTIPCFQLFGSSGEDVLLACETFRGQLADGESCFNELECGAVGSECDKDDTCGFDAAICCPGFCVAPAALGGSCQNGERCVNGAHCVNGFCAAGEQGDPCSDDDDDCDQAFWCNATVCSTDFAGGEQCAKEAQCQGGHSCIGEDPDTGTPGICVDVRVVGNECEPGGTGGDGVSNGCFDALFCDVPLAGTQGVCTEFPSVGETCGTSDEDDDICPFILVCDEAQCADRGNAGDECGNTSATTFCNIDLFCSTEISGLPNGTCTAPQTNNSTCNEDGQCASGLCNLGNNLCEAYASCFL
jgi:hypothetical protein